MRLLVVSEGSGDVRDPGVGDGEGRGAVGTLVVRLIEDKLGRQLADPEVHVDKLPRVHGAKGYARKVHLLIVDAEVRGFDAVAVVVDRDRTPGRSRLKLLQQGCELASQSGKPLAERTAIGVAIETVEAWLLADEVALRDALGLSELPTQRAPETLTGAPGDETHPKMLFQKLVARGTADRAQAPNAVARLVRLDVLRQRCPEGFEPFAQEVERRCRA